MKTNTLILTLSTVLLLSSPLALAHPGKGWQGEGQRHERTMLPLKQLDLSAEQRAQIQSLMQQHREARQQQRNPEAMQQLLDAPQFDELAAQQLLAQRAQQREQHQLARLKLQHQIHQILTPEQRQQLAELRSQRQSGEGKPWRQHSGERKERKARQPANAG